MRILDKIVVSTIEPPSISCLWIKPVSGGVALYIFDGFWKLLRLMNGHDTMSPDDDTPIDIHEGQLGPDTVGTEQIIDGAIEEQDLHDDVKDRMTVTHDSSTGGLRLGGYAKPGNVPADNTQNDNPGGGFND